MSIKTKIANLVSRPEWLAGALRSGERVLAGGVLIKLGDLLDLVFDRDAPAWRRALYATALLEVSSVAGISVPVAVALRYIVLHGLLTADERPARYACPCTARPP